MGQAPVRYFYDWMAAWPLVARPWSATALAKRSSAPHNLPTPAQLLQQPVRTIVDNAVHARDRGNPSEAGTLLHRAVRARAISFTYEARWGSSAIRNQLPTIKEAVRQARTPPEGDAESPFRVPFDDLRCIPKMRQNGGSARGYEILANHIP